MCVHAIQQHPVHPSHCLPRSSRMNLVVVIVFVL
jgi:hypothetical protein